MDSQDSQKQAWHKPEMISLAGSASAAGTDPALAEATKILNPTERGQGQGPGGTAGPSG